MDPTLSHVLIDSPPENITQIPPVLLDKRAAETPNKEALVCVDDKGRRAMTFLQLQLVSRNLAAWFMKFGLEQGDRVAIFSNNCVEYAACELALMRLGVCLTRFYTMFSTRDDLQDTMMRSQCKLLIVQESSMETILGFIPELLFRMEGSRLECGQFPDLIQVITLGRARDGFLSLESDYKASDDELKSVDRLQSKIDIDDDCTIHQTSGSTGKPKLGVISFYGKSNLLFQTFHKCGLDANDRLFTDRPMAHPLGTFMPILQFGCTMIIANAVATIKNADMTFIRNVLEQERVTAAIFLPYLMYDIVQTQSANHLISKLKFAICSGQTPPKDVMERINDVMKRVCVGYGCTEVGDISCSSPGDDATIITETVGKLLPNLEMRIVDDEGHVVPRDTSGQLEFKARGFKRYHGDEDTTHKSMSDNCWFRPGDIGQIDDQNRLRLSGRETEKISIATRTIFPAEIENQICKFSKVDKAIAFGIPDKRLYQKIGVCVKPKIGVKVTEQEVLDYCSSIAKEEDLFTGVAAIPSHVFVMDGPLPVTPSGKMSRLAVREQCLAKLGFVNV